MPQARNLTYDRPVMSISKLSTGDGYAYYTAMTATGDERRAAGQELGDYYLESGAPQGRWVGRGCGGLGVAGGVHETQMKALFGEGRHPEADKIEADVLAAGGSAAAAERASRLGRRPAKGATQPSDLAKAINERVRAEEAKTGEHLDVDRLRQLRMQEASKAYEDRFGHRASDPKELATFLAKELRRGTNPVAGYDLTFSPPKSVSVLWGLSDREHADAIAAAHDAAIADTVVWLEDHAIGSRSGAGGVAHVDVRGLVATQFRHHDSREGDPQLHDHVVVANRVQDASTGKWLTLDGAALYRNVVAASEHYNRALVQHVSALGYSFTARQMGAGKRPVLEVDGVDPRLLSATAKRSAKIRQRTAELVSEYTERHGRTPDTKTMHQLRQQATLETRAPKAEHRSLDEMRAEWAEEAANVVGPDALRDLPATALTAAAGARERAIAVRDGLDIIGAGEEIIRELAQRRSTWAERDIRAEVERWAARSDGALLSDFQREAVVQYARDVACVNLTPASQVPTFDPLTRADGSSVYEPRDRAIYTSVPMIEAEYRLIDAARELAIPAASTATFDATLAAQPMRLDQGQIDLAHHFACGESVLAIGIGPAGAGKTTAMRLAVDTIKADGGRVVGLSVAATAAAQLEESTGAESTTLAQWLHYRRKAADQEIPSRFALHSGDVLIIDEAGMAGTLMLDEVTQDARAAGAHVRLIGDDRQLQAVESGGALRMIAAEAGASLLTEIHRFRDPEESAASLQLRDGDLSWYESAGRIHSGRHADLIEAVAQAWDRDDAAGRTSLMMADTNDQVAELNGRAQDLRVARGQVSLDVTASLRDGHQAGIGDRVVTRRVDRSLTVDGTRDCVKNGDVWTVDAITDDRSLRVRREDGKTVTLPAEYVRDSTELGYASTVHRAQGRTVDVARALATTATSREGLYVAMTRGRHGNELFVATDERPRAEILARITTADRRDVAARDAMLAEAHRVDSAAELARQHEDVTQRADGLRYTQTLRTVFGADAEPLLTSEARSAVDAALRRAEDAGYDLHRVLERHRGLLDTEDDPSRLLAWRIRRDLEQGEAQASAQDRRPLRDLSRERLTALADTSAVRRAEARAAMQLLEARHSYDAKPIQVGERTIPAWTDRDQGNLTRPELSDRIGLTRWLVADSEERERDASDRARTLRARWRQERSTGTSITDPRMQRLAGELAEAERATDSARARTRGNRIELETLKAESKTRRQLPTRAWHLEEAQREAQRRRGLSDQQHVASRVRTTLELEEAHRVYAREEVIDSSIRAELRRREVEPDHPVAVPTDGLPRWLAPDRGTGDPAMPVPWGEHLQERRQILKQRILADGAALAQSPPPWTRELGEIPAAGTRERRRWEAAAGQVQAWRDLHEHVDSERALPLPEEVEARDRSDLTQLRTVLHPVDTARPQAPTSLADRVAARQGRHGGAGTLSEAQQRAEEQMRQQLERHQRETRGPVQQ